MTNKYFLFEIHHCGHKWHSLSERSRCRSCRKMVRAQYKALVNGPESKDSFVNKFSEVFK